MDEPVIVLHPDPAPPTEPAPTELLVRASVHLPGLAVGDVALVDPNDAYMAALLAGSLIVPVDG